MAPVKKSFTGTEYCGLCRGQFPPMRLQGLNAWQSEFRAALCLNAENEQGYEITEVASLPNTRHDVDVDVFLTEPPQIQTVTIRRSSLVNAECPSYGSAFCFHDWCYSVLIWKLRCHPPRSIIYKLVRTLIPDSSIWENVCEAGSQLDPIGSLQSLIAHADHYQFFMPQFLFMSTLPVEVRARIWEFVGLDTPYSAFILVAGETSRLARYVKSRNAHDLALERGYHLSAKTAIVFGTEYIQHLSHNEDLKLTLRVLRDVTKFKFVVSLSGICAIKLLGVDWETDWLGKVPGIGHFWHGTVQNITPCLRCAYNDLNCVSITSIGLHSTNLVLWDQPNVPSSLNNPDVSLFDYDRDIIGSSRPPITTYKRRFFRYLPLYNDTKYIIGLTLYQTSNGIVGLEAHFTRKSQLSGCRNGCALYFPFCSNEQIAYIWLRILDFHSVVFAAPALVPGLVIENLYKWVLLKNKGCISGLYYENSSSGTKIMRLGITDDGNSKIDPPLTPQYHERICPPFPGPNGGTFLSVADLSDLDKVDLCRVSTRCIGILIEYVDSRTAVLGQWRPRGISHHSCLYNRNTLCDTTSITNIHFTLTRSGNHKIVTDISFLEDMDKVVPDSEYHIFDLGQKIAWWFSEFSDAIVPWTGEVRDVPDESKINQEQFVV